jgi:hypothetical protein
MTELRITSEQLAEAVKQGTVAGAKIHRRRLMKWTAIIVFFVSLVVAGMIAAAVTKVVFDSVNAANLARQKANCDLVTTSASVLDDFLRSDARDRQGQLTAADRAKVFASFGKILEPSLLKRLNDSQQRLDKRTIAYWRGPLRARLRTAVLTGCRNR